MKRWLYFPRLVLDEFDRYIPTTFGSTRLSSTYLPTSIGRLTGGSIYFPTTLGALVKYRPAINYPNTAELTYQNNGDDNGLFYAMGSNFSSTAWYNPIDVAYIIASASSISAGNLNQIVDRNISIFNTANGFNEFVEVFIGNNYLFQPKRYLIRSWNDSNHLPRNWNLEGSTDGSNWTVIDDQVNNTGLMVPNQWLLLTVPERKVGAYNYFRIKSTGLNSSNQNLLSLGELELYGTFSKVAFYTPVPIPPVRTVYTYQSDGDTNGVLYAIGTNFGNSSWRNPNLRASVTSASSIGSGTINDLVDRNTNDFYTQSLPNSYIQIDIGIYNRLNCNRYSIRNRTAVDFYLRNWKLEGSNNKLSWTLLDSQNNNTTIQSPNQWITLSPSAGVSTAFRYFRITQTGLNSSNTDHLCMGEIELYGTLTVVPPQDTTPPTGTTYSTHTHNTDGDANGVIYRLATNFGTTAWANPITSRSIEITTNGIGAGTLASVVDRQPSEFYTDGTANSYVQIDLGRKNRLKCNKITIRNRNTSNTHILRSWKWEGSNDLDEWRLIDSRTNDSSMTAASDWYTVIPNTNTTDYFRYFRLTITGVTSENSYFICLGELELYGELGRLPAVPINETYSYSSNGDLNGLFYDLGTEFGNAPWTNPAKGNLAVFSALTVQSAAYDVDRAVDLGSSTVPYHSNAASGNYFQWDLLSGNNFVCKHYVVKGREDFPAYYPKTWDLVGSNDGTNWTVIDSIADSGITSSNLWFSKALPSNTTAFRYHRLLQTGVDSSGTNHLIIGEMEVYGTLNYSY